MPTLPLLTTDAPCGLAHAPASRCAAPFEHAVRSRSGLDPAFLRRQPLSALTPDADRPELPGAPAVSGRACDALPRNAEGRRREVAVDGLSAGSGTEGHRVVRDPTSERRLRRKLKVQAAILAEVWDAVVVLDEADHVVCWNAGAEGLFGRGAAAMVGAPLAPIFGPPARERLRRALAEARFGAPRFVDIEWRRFPTPARPALLRLSISRMAGVDPGHELSVVLACPCQAVRSTEVPS